MTTPLFVQHAADPSLIPGIYDTCDQWCMYCPATAWCLAYRCGAHLRSPQENPSLTLANRLYEGIAFLKQISMLEGRSTPEIDAMLADDPRKRVQLVVIDDPLEANGRRYGRLSREYLRSRRDLPVQMMYRSTGPTPIEVPTWYHAFIPAKIYRALVSAHHVARGDSSRHDDVLMSAKVALIGIDRSLDALASMITQDSDASLDSLAAQLRRLRRELQARFPSARAFVRPGLDVPGSA